MTLQDRLEIAEEELENNPSQAAPSGEWAEYNVYHLQCIAEVESLEEAIQLVGSCSTCKYCIEDSNDDSVWIECKKKDSPMYGTSLIDGKYPIIIDWYCADFERIKNGRN